MLAIIQARMSSRRLPGKVLKPLAGRPMLGWVAARVSAARELARVAVATSVDATDDPVAEFCERERLPCHRGPLNDVATRFSLAAAAEGADAFVRITGDSPLIDPAIIDQAVRLYHGGEWDLVSNVLARTFPIGQSVEVLRASTFDQVFRSTTDADHREHVTQSYYASLKSFRIVGFTSGMDASAVQLSVDTAEDFESIARVLAASGNNPGGWRKLIAMKKETE
jgi:spore coat polysaccharide biosynthesis protein SpsF